MNTHALALNDTERRIAERIDTGAASQLAVSDAAGGLAFVSMAQVMEFAKMMSVGGIAIPKHLRGNPGSCMAVTLQAVEWRMSPYAVANKSYSVNDRLAYESQLIQAVILQRAPIKGRFKVEYLGEGEKRRCRVTATLDDGSGETVDYTSPEFSRIQPKNSPLWKTDPDQQQFYYSGRALCRRHFPDVLLGVYARDEIEDQPRDPVQARDVSPPRGLGARLDALAGKPAASAALAAADEFVEVATEADIAAQEAAGEESQAQAAADETVSSEAEEAPVDPNDADFKRGVEDRAKGLKKCLITAIREDDERFRKWRAGYDSVEGEAA